MYQFHKLWVQWIHIAHECEDITYQDEISLIDSTTTCWWNLEMNPIRIVYETKRNTFFTTNTKLGIRFLHWTNNSRTLRPLQKNPSWPRMRYCVCAGLLVDLEHAPKAFQCTAPEECTYDVLCISSFLQWRNDDWRMLTVNLAIWNVRNVLDRHNIGKILS